MGSIATDQVASARRSNATISALEPPYPLFVHKWSRGKRRYLRHELELPQTLNCRGLAPDVRGGMVAIGGTRSPTVETFCLVSQLVRRLCTSGAAIISGGVPGVDLAGHLAAVESEEGRTWAVMANPVGEGLRGHEWSNQLVERAIIAQGGFLSEYEDFVAINSDSYRERLLQRDRIISGLCDVFLAFECNRFSATVDTALRAKIQGKAVFGIRPSIRSLRIGVDSLAQHGIPILDPTEMNIDAMAVHISAAVASAIEPR